MKRAMIKILNTHDNHYFGEFHTVAGLFQPYGDDTKIAVGYIENIEV
jgi:hypothetical protein